MSQEHSINRRAVLWNVQQPGDAYDIRKSMIARLPEHPARFMGDNLQLVCLFQAAEIQRLAQFLDQMTLQMRAMQRIQLDRHSYQVQIKELAQKLQLTNQYKSENAKLREFIKGQSQELQNLQRYRNASQNLIELQTKYESVLNELKISRQNFSVLQRSNNQSLREIGQWRLKGQRAQKSLMEERSVRQREIKMGIQKASLQMRQRLESRQYQLKGEINIMKQNLMLKNRQIELQKSKNQQLGKLLSEKQDILGKYARGEIQTPTNKTQQLLRISRKLEESTYYLQQKQKNILNLKDEITYLNKKLKSHQEEFKKKDDELRKKQQDIRKKDEDIKKKHQDIRKKDLQIQAKQKTLAHNQQLIVKISEKDQKIILLSSQIERFNQSLAIKDKQNADKERQLSFYKEKAVSYERTVDFLQKQLKDKQTVIKRLEHNTHVFQDKDNKIAALGGEIQRLNMVMRQKLNEMSRLEKRFNDLTQSYNQQFNLLRARQQAIRMLQDKCRDYDMKIGSSQETNKLNFDEINRLTLKLAGVENQNIQLRREIDSKIQIGSQVAHLKNQLSDTNEDLNRKSLQNKKLREDNEMMFKQISELQGKIRKSQIHIHDLQLKIDTIEIEKDSQMKDMQATFTHNEQRFMQQIDMYMKSMPKMSAEIERLHQMMEKRNADMKKLQQELDIQREKNRIIERRNSTQSEMRILEYERTIAFYQSKCKNLEKINSDLANEKNLIVEKVQSLELKLREGQVEFDKLTTALKVKEATFDEHEKNATILQSAVNQLREENLALQKESLKNRQELQSNFELIRRVQYELDLSRRDLSKSQGNCAALNEQILRLKGMMEQSQYKNPEMVQTIESLRHQLAKNENERQHLMQEMNEKRIRIQAYENDLRNLQIKISQHQQSVKHIEQANAVKLQEVRQRMMQDFDVRIKNEVLKYTKLQQLYRQLQANCTTNVRNLEQRNEEKENLQSRNNELIQHLNEYQQKLFSYQERFALLSQEIQRLTMENRQWRGMNEKRAGEQENENEKVRLLNEELEKTRIEVSNLRLMLQQLESINEHAIAQRDELFEISHQQQEMIQKQKHQINALTNEIMQLRRNQTTESSQLTKLRDQYNSILNQHTELKQQYNQLNRQIQLSNKQLAEFNTATIREQQINTQQTQLRLNNLTQHYESILKQQRQRLAQSERNMETKSRALTILQKENIELKERVNEMAEKISSQEDILSQVEELKTAYINIKMENEQLNRLLQEMQQQLFQAKQNSARKTQQQQAYSGLMAQNTQLKSKLQQQRQALLTMRQKLSNISIQLQQLQHSKAETDQRYKALENNFSIVQNENNYLKQQLDNLREELAQTAVYQEISVDLENKYNALYQAYQQTYNVYNLQKIEYQNTKENLRLTEIKIQQLNQQFDKLNLIITQLKNQIHLLTEENQHLHANYDHNTHQFHQLTLNNQDLQKELQRVYQMNLDLTNQVSQTRLRLCDQHALEATIKNNMVLFVMMCAEIQSLRKRVLDSQQQCQQVRRSSISPLKIKK